MRVLADLVKDTNDTYDLMIVEILAAQVIAAAKYHGRTLGTASEIMPFVRVVAGYPMLNRPKGQQSITPNIETATADRVREILNASGG